MLELQVDVSPPTMNTATTEFSPQSSEHLDIMPKNPLDDGRYGKVEGKFQNNANHFDPYSDTPVDESRLSPAHPGTVSYPAGAGHGDK